ncbi:MAG: hypothetical protein ACOCUS_01170 [Polyangiales bacterium]
MRRARLACSTLLLIAAALAGCGDVKPGKEIDAAPSCPATDAETGTWHSNPWMQDGCPWMEYPSKTALVVPHDLGRQPDVVLPYISFDSEGRDATLGSGDVARILDTSDVTVTVGNATEQKLFLRLVLR